MATYKLTQQSGQFSGSSHSDFPAYVDLTEIDPSMSQADADSIRVYSDASLSTELAREIVSTEEMHVKIPTFTSGDEIWVSIDGSRADYNTTDTFGAENVWSDYGGVWHFQDDSGTSVVNSENSEINSTKNSPTSISGPIGNTLEYDASASQGVDLEDGTTTSNPYFTDGSEFVISFIFNSYADGTPDGNQSILHCHGAGSSIADRNAGISVVHLSDDDINVSKGVGANNSDKGFRAGALSRNTKYHVKIVHSGSTVSFYVDGVLFNSGDLNSGNVDWDGAAYHNPRNQIGIGDRPSGTNDGLEGYIDELRIKNSVTGIDADFAETEYNNQNSPSTFWSVEEVVSRRIFNIS